MGHLNRGGRQYVHLGYGTNDDLVLLRSSWKVFIGCSMGEVLYAIKTMKADWMVSQGLVGPALCYGFKRDHRRFM